MECNTDFSQTIDISVGQNGLKSMVLNFEKFVILAKLYIYHPNTYSTYSMYIHIWIFKETHQRVWNGQRIACLHNSINENEIDTHTNIRAFLGKWQPTRYIQQTTSIFESSDCPRCRGCPPTYMGSSVRQPAWAVGSVAIGRWPEQYHLLHYFLLLAFLAAIAGWPGRAAIRVGVATHPPLRATFTGCGIARLAPSGTIRKYNSAALNI